MSLDLKQLPKPANRWRQTLWIIIDTPNGFKDVLAEKRSVVIHKGDDDQEYLLAFEDLTHAQRVQEEYEPFANNKTHIVSFNVYNMNEDWNLRLYRMDGSWLDISQEDYLRHLIEQDK
jgi:hypothetical protein